MNSHLHISLFVLSLITGGCAPLQRASFATPIATTAPALPAQSLDTIVIPADEWSHDRNGAERPICDVGAKLFDVAALARVELITTELARSDGACDPTAAAATPAIHVLSVACDAEHATVSVDGVTFAADRIYAASRALPNGERALLVEAMARGSGAILTAAVAFDAPPLAPASPAPGSRRAFARVSTGNANGYFAAQAADDDVVVVPSFERRSAEMFLLRRGSLPERGVYLVGPAAADGGRSSILAARFVVGS
jgi:hypothetical protein